MKKIIILALLLFAAAVCLSSCQAVEGFGRDVQWTGESIQKTVD
jgi:predicted small secreted protein